jgi:hypothetical protein
MTESMDQRKSRRLALFDDFQVLDSQTGELLGYMRDVSSHGMMVVGSLAPAVDQVYKLAIVLPELIMGEKMFELQATCRWHTIDVRRGFHNSGFQFGELTQQARHILEQIESDYEFSKSESGF